jgi:hypothetical protein
MYMLTTIDNPYNPFTQFNEWYTHDVFAGHNSLALLARIALFSDEMSDTDQQLAIDNAIDEIVYENVSGMHRKITADGKYSMDASTFDFVKAT